MENTTNKQSFSKPLKPLPPCTVVPVPVLHCTTVAERLWCLFQAITLESFVFGYYMIAVSVVKGLF